MEREDEKVLAAALRALDASAYGGMWKSDDGLVTVAYVGERPDPSLLYGVDRIVERNVTYLEVIDRQAELNANEPDEGFFWIFDWENAIFERAGPFTTIPAGDL